MKILIHVHISFYTPPHNSGGVLWFHVGRPCVRPYVFRFRMITWVNINGFSPNLVCALILWSSGLGLLLGKFRQTLTEISARDTPIFSFPNDKLSRYQGILTKLGTCIDTKEIWVGIANGQISSIFDRVNCPRHDNGWVLWFYVFHHENTPIQIYWKFDHQKYENFQIKILIFFIFLLKTLIVVLARTASPIYVFEQK